MRILLVLLLLATPAGAWEFTRIPTCTLSQDDGATEVAVTYDPTLPEYAIRLTRKQPWPEAPVFALRFDGPYGLTISTDRHELSDGGRTLTVRDKGFGNVLRGMAFNHVATALSGTAAVPFPLAGAGPNIKEFSECTTAPLI